MLHNKIKFFAFLVFTLLFSVNVHGQADSAKRIPIKYTSQYLNVDITVARKINEVQAQYKSAAKAIIANPLLSAHAKRKSIDSLIEVKNSRLESLIPIEQQRNKIVPMTERRRRFRRADSTISGSNN